MALSRVRGAAGTPSVSVGRETREGAEEQRQKERGHQGAARARERASEREREKKGGRERNRHTNRGRERERETERDREDGYVVPDDAGAGGGSHHSRLRVCVLPPYPGPH